MSETITTDDILGKDAVDKEGDILGVTIQLHVDKKSKALTGITIDQGFMKPNLFVGMEYVKHFGVDAVFLNYVPRTRCKGMKVISAKGEVKGTVVDVKMNKGKLKTITFAKNKFSRENGKQVDANHIQSISTSVLLKEEAKIDDYKEERTNAS